MVAVKVSRFNGAASGQLGREFALAAAISHPNVVRVYDLIQTSHGPAIIMALVEGETLATLLGRQQRLPMREVLKITSQLCSALQAIHDSGIVHLNLAPENLLIDAKGNLVITDFGSAALAADGAPRLRSVPQTPASLKWASPEMRSGRGVDHRSDIFGVGLLLYSILTGTEPEIDCPSGARELPVDLRTGASIQLSRAVPAPFETITLGCLFISPSLRYQTAKAVRADLQRLDVRRAARGSSPADSFVAHWTRFFYAGLKAGALVVILCVLVVVPSSVILSRTLDERRQAESDYQRGVHLLSENPDLGTLEQAAGHLRKSTTGNAAHKLAHIELSKASLVLYERTKSERWLRESAAAAERAVLLAPDAVEAKLALAGVRVAQGRFGEALGATREVLAVAPNSDSAYRIAARCHLGVGNLADARAASEEAVNISTRSTANLGLLAVVLTEAGALEQAVATFRKVIELDPANLDALNNLGTLLLRLGQPGAAAHSLEAALQIDATPVIYSNLGTAYFLSRHFKLSALMFEKAVSQSPDSAVLRANLGEAYYWSGDRAAANREVDLAISLTRSGPEWRRSNPDVVARVGFLLARRGRFAEAHRVLVMLPSSTNARGLYALAMVELLKGKQQEALHLLESALVKGYPAFLALADPNWDLIAADDRFLALRKRFGTPPNLASSKPRNQSELLP